MGSRSQTQANASVWFQVALVAGALLAIVLIANSVLNYIYVSRRIVVEHVRRDMRTRVAALEREIRQAGGADAVETVLRRFQNGASSLWIQVRGRDGKLLAYSGSNTSRAFDDKFIESRMSRREPVFALRDTPQGKAVVELFPIWFGPRTGGHVEMAMLLDSAGPGFWPLQRNLIISCSAAIALLISLIVMRLRFRDYLRGRKLEAEVEMARELQRSLLPRGNETLRGLSVAAEFLPASEVGGDLYDAFETETGAALVVGDVSGKGLPAALLMGVIHGAIRSGDWHESEEAHGEAAQRLNRFLCERAPGSRYATLFWGSFDRRSSQLRYINAGHCPPLLVRRRRGNVEVHALDEGGPVLGLLSIARYRQGTVDLLPGDLLILYSDGLVEATNPAGEEFGEQRLRHVLQTAMPDTAADARNAILDALRDFAGPLALHDDLTLMAVRFDHVAPGVAPETVSVVNDGNLVAG